MEKGGRRKSVKAYVTQPEETEKDKQENQRKSQVAD